MYPFSNMISFDLSFFVLHLDLFLNIELVVMKFKVYVHVTLTYFGYTVSCPPQHLFTSLQMTILYNLVMPTRQVVLFIYNMLAGTTHKMIFIVQHQQHHHILYKYMQ